MVYQENTSQTTISSVLRHGRNSWAHYQWNFPVIEEDYQSVVSWSNRRSPQQRHANHRLSRLSHLPRDSVLGFGLFNGRTGRRGGSQRKTTTTPRTTEAQAGDASTSRVRTKRKIHWRLQNPRRVAKNFLQMIGGREATIW